MDFHKTDLLDNFIYISSNYLRPAYHLKIQQEIIEFYRYIILYNN